MLTYRNKNAKQQFLSNLTWCAIELKMIMMGLEDMLPFLGNINGNLKMFVIYTDLYRYL